VAAEGDGSGTVPPADGIDACNALKRERAALNRYMDAVRDLNILILQGNLQDVQR
jgi:hypothetical protein